MVLFGESMVSGGNIDDVEMGEFEVAGWGFQGKGRIGIGRKEKYYNALEVVRFTDTPHIFTLRLGSVWCTLPSKEYHSLHYI